MVSEFSLIIKYSILNFVYGNYIAIDVIPFNNMSTISNIFHSYSSTLLMFSVDDDDDDDDDDDTDDDADADAADVDEDDDEWPPL